MRRIVGIGAGGHAKILIELLKLTGGYDLVGFTDTDHKRWGSYLMGCPLLGGDEYLIKLRAEGVTAAFIGVGAVSCAGTRVRQRLFAQALSLGFDFPTLEHPAATVSPSAKVGAGTVVMAGVVISAAVQVGTNATIYSNAVIEHDSKLGNDVHVSPGVSIAGTVTLGEGVFVGIGASIIQGVHIGDWATIGAGAAVVNDVAGGKVVVGVPARTLDTAERQP